MATNLEYEEKDGDMSAYLYVKNWDELQHYKSRNPPWIKLYRRLMTDGKFHTLTEREQWQLVRIWLVSAEEHPGGYVPNDEKWLRRMTHSLQSVPVQKFVSDGWLQTVTASQYASVRASALASNGASAEGEIDPLSYPPEVQRNIKNLPSFLPTSTTDGKEGGTENGEHELPDLATILREMPA